eukprot:PLAT15589.1.p2 GENE.PLAT15589.1~~PLAT15589.1.p2  ORF type:complete len:469 (+),score=221.01 PLAT15589.1:28-1407(+)
MLRSSLSSCLRPLGARALSTPLAATPCALAASMKAAGVSRGYLVWDSDAQDVVASHDVLEPLADFFRADKLDYLEHEGVFLQVGEKTGALHGAFLWWTQRGAGCGGVRLRPYDTLEEYLRDGLRLAQGMGRKSALAGLWAGGGKGVIAQQAGDSHLLRDYRDALFTEYGQFVSSLQGAYVAAEDAGLNVEDLDVMHGASRFVTCISPSRGGSGNPSVPTAAGVVVGMEAALDFLGMGDLSGKRIAMQGAGNVGLPMMKMLLDAGVSSIVASDIDRRMVDRAMDEVGSDDRVSISLIEKGDDSILDEHCDILAPCAFGGVLTPETIPRIKASIVCGAANNQLADPTDDKLLMEHGIVYCPDFVVNRMGIVNCADEAFGRVGRMGTMDDPALQRQLGRDWENSVFNITRRILEMARDKGMTPGEAANVLSTEYCLMEHPIHGHRSAAIIKSLVECGWADGE